MGAWLKLLLPQASRPKRSRRTAGAHRRCARADSGMRAGAPSATAAPPGPLKEREQPHRPAAPLPLPHRSSPTPFLRGCWR